VNPESDSRYRDYVHTFLEVAGREGYTPDVVRSLVRTSPTVIAALAVQRGEADAMLCGLEGRFANRLKQIRDIIGLAPGVLGLSAMSMLISTRGVFFVSDTHVRTDPTPQEIADMTTSCVKHVHLFGMEPKVALLSHSDFGSHDSPSSRKMRAALALIQAQHPELEVDGEMHADTALSGLIREKVLPGSRLKGEANLLIMPNLDAANIAFQFAKVLGDALPVGPILMGAAKPAHVLTSSVTARGIVNMTAIAVVEAQSFERTERA